MYILLAATKQPKLIQYNIISHLNYICSKFKSILHIHKIVYNYGSRGFYYKSNDHSKENSFHEVYKQVKRPIFAFPSILSRTLYYSQRYRDRMKLFFIEYPLHVKLIFSILFSPPVTFQGTYFYLHFTMRIRK